ncbi:MAG: CPBP family intramembrane metalloprotease [Hyphomonadaceae bacterium]|nr:CPBP family intramembrane metalloprotease [Hyphomonadaceae bacterium]MBC6412620.1 CPBP family intramembrane metalloprotease [Hyphomonadaceae bacterium]
MNRNAHAYFSQTQHGESRLWSWLIAFWFVLVGWTVTQQLIVDPVPEIIRGQAPELYQSFMDKHSEIIENAGPEQTGAIVGGLMLSGLVTSVLCIMCLAFGGARRIIGPLALITGLTSLYFMHRIMTLPGSAEANELFLDMMGVSPAAYMLMLLTFPATLTGVYLVQKFIHKRTLISLHTAAGRIDWMRILFAVAVTWTVYAVVMGALHFTGTSPLQNTFDPARFFTYALVTLLFIPLQSGTEEVIFRGYLNQGFGHFIPGRWTVFVITSAAFASLHLANPESVAGAREGGFMHLAVMSSYFMFGFLLSVLVYYEGGLEAAIGVHAANNMFAALFVNYEGSVLPTPSVFLAVSNPPVDLPVMVLSLGVVVFILYKTRKPIPG